MNTLALLASASVLSVDGWSIYREDVGCTAFIKQDDQSTVSIGLRVNGGAQLAAMSASWKSVAARSYPATLKLHDKTIAVAAYGFRAPDANGFIVPVPRSSFSSVSALGGNVFVMVEGVTIFGRGGLGRVVGALERCEKGIRDPFAK